MQLISPSIQVHRVDQSYQAKIVVAMQMGNEDMVDLLQAETWFTQLHLCPFPAIQQKHTVSQYNEMGGRVAVRCRDCSPGTKDGDGEVHKQM